MVYFPEVMWAIFYSVIGNNDRGLSECVQMKQIMNKIKHKYKALDKDVTLNSLCGNKYWHNEITVTKYLCGKTILNNMRTLLERKKDKKKQENPDGSKNGDNSDSQQKEVKDKKQRGPNACQRLFTAITRSKFKEEKVQLPIVEDVENKKKKKGNKKSKGSKKAKVEKKTAFQEPIKEENDQQQPAGK